MSYCLNPACRQPQNPSEADYCQNCGHSLLLGERYRAIELIGQGGFGKTFLAIDEGESGQPFCVIKQLLPHLQAVSPQKAIELFRREAERLAVLGQHPQIPTLLDHFESATVHYLVQEYIDGLDLAEVLRQEGPFSENQIRDLLADLLPVLRFIHGHKVIHRDIKPENIICPVTGDRYVLVDFGASKFASGTALARTGTVIGSAEYVAPEQAMGKAEFASDLYSLGVTCVHLLTGIHPFDLYSVSEDAWVWRQYLPKPISSELRQVLDKLLQKATSQRYRTATAVLQDLHLIEAPRRSPTSTAKPLPPDPDQSWRCVQMLYGHGNSITAIAVSPDGQLLASGSSDRSVKIWDLMTGELLHTFEGRGFWMGDGHRDRISGLTFSPDNYSIFSSSDDGTVKEWDLTTFKLVMTLSVQSWATSALAISHDGWVIASGGTDGVIHLWDLETRDSIAALTQHTDQITALLLSPDDRLLVSSSYDKTIRLWDFKTDDLVATLKGHVDRVTAIALTPDGRTLLSGSADKTVKIWTFPRGEQHKVLAAHGDQVNCLAIDPDGVLFASGSEDGSLTIWDLDSADRLCTVRHAWGVNAIAFSPDGELLISGSADETIKIWQRSD